MVQVELGKGVLDFGAEGLTVGDADLRGQDGNAGSEGQQVILNPKPCELRALGLTIEEVERLRLGIEG